MSQKENVPLSGDSWEDGSAFPPKPTALSEQQDSADEEAEEEQFFEVGSS
jgi:hypothetical protein